MLHPEPVSGGAALENVIERLIARKAVHARKGIVMGEECWVDIFDHLREEVKELEDAVWANHALPGSAGIGEEIGDILGIVVHAALKAGFSVGEIVNMEIEKLKERFPE